MHSQCSLGVDDHQMVCIHGIELIVNEKLPFSANDIKKLRMIVGVGDGIPVSTVFGTGDIQQLYSTANRIGSFLIHGVMTSAHGRIPHCLYFIDIDIIARKTAGCKMRSKIGKRIKARIKLKIT